jgi:hypothetical protein
MSAPSRLLACALVLSALASASALADERRAATPPARAAPVQRAPSVPIQRGVPQPSPQQRTQSSAALRAAGQPQATSQLQQGVQQQVAQPQQHPADLHSAALRSDGFAPPLDIAGPLHLSEPAAPPPAPQHPLAPQAGTPEAALHVRLVVRQIAAHRQGEQLEIDGRLQPIDRDLRSFAQDFNYKYYQLIDEQVVELGFAQARSVALPGLRSLELQPTEVLKDGRLRIHLELLGPQPGRERKLHTDYSLPRGRTLLLGGYRLEPSTPGGPSGTLLLAITQAE